MGTPLFVGEDGFRCGDVLISSVGPVYLWGRLAACADQPSWLGAAARASRTSSQAAFDVAADGTVVPAAAAAAAAAASNFVLLAEYTAVASSASAPDAAIELFDIGHDDGRTDDADEPKAKRDQQQRGSIALVPLD